MNLADQIIQFCRENGLFGLFILAFTDSFISPVMPDIVMVPLCLADPDRAVYYSLVATVASVLGGFIGYMIGARLGPVCVQRLVPEHHWARINHLVEKHGGWAVFWGAIAPIPYKFVSISAGVLGLNLRMFIFITILGRSKRFLLEGILIYYFGSPLIEGWNKYSEYSFWFAAGGILLSAAVVYAFKYFTKPPQRKCL